MKKGKIFITLFILIISSLYANEKPKIIDASYDSKKVVITLFYRDDPNIKKKIHMSSPEIIINGKKYFINDSDTFITESQTGKRNVIVEFIFEIPKNLKVVNIEKATVKYSFEKKSPALEVKSFTKIKE